MSAPVRPFGLVRAMPIAERASAGRRGLAPARGLPPSAARSLALWRSQSPFGDPQRFAERLASDALSEGELLRLLALEDADVEPPRWIRWFEEDLAAGAPQTPQTPDGALLERFMARAAVELRGAVAAARARSGLEIEGAVEAAMIAALARRLRRLVRPTLALELQVAELRGEITGETPAARSERFAARMADPAVASALWSEYPVLARQVTVCTEQWCAASVELLSRLAAEWHEVRRSLGAPREARSLLEVSLGEGDTHRGGRSVAVLTFSGGFRLVYKPRSLAIDAHFGELLAWLADRGSPRLRTPRVLDRGSHGWAEFVAHAPCRSAAEVERFHERQGAQLALLYALEATDFHAENLIASGDDPVLIDLETVLQPRVLASRAGAAGALDTSVLRVGLVSVNMRDDAGVDFSGVGGGDPRRPARHLAWFGGQPVRAADHAEAFVRGFEAMAAILIRELPALLASGGPLERFAGDPVRVVVRATEAYALLLRESVHPDCLRDAVERERAFDRLWFETRERPELARVIRHERDDLWREDVPYFSTTPGSRDLVSSAGARIEGFLAESALTGARRRLGALAEELPRQRWILREALAATLSGRVGSAPEREPAPLAVAAGASDTPRRLVAAACGLAERLRARAIDDRRQVLWLDVQRAAGGSTIRPCGVDLYAGTAGIALFFAALARASGEARYGEFADVVMRGVVDALADGGGPGTIGGFDGAGGLLYALAQFAATRPDRRYHAAADRLIERIAAGCDDDDQLDVISGSAGAIGGLLAWARVDATGRALAAAARCGRHLLGRARETGGGLAWTCGPERPPLVGYAHGAAGIGAMLGALGGALGEPRFVGAARAALAFERSLFDPAVGAWPDVEARAGRLHRASWCRGAVGCGLARAQALRCGLDARAAEELGHACAFVRTASPRDDSLCHGTLGALELLSTGAALRGDPELRLDVTARAGALLDALERRGPRCGGQGGAETPGLLVGVAGIGLGLLRLAAPEQVPSVLTLEPPAPL